VSDHLPECLLYDATLMLPCICDRLRAAEQRQGALSYAHGLDHGYAAGIKAARDAVAAFFLNRDSLGYMHYYDVRKDVADGLERDMLAAIDALTQ
jgi:hypothetical protein